MATNIHPSLLSSSSFNSFLYPPLQPSEVAERVEALWTYYAENCASFSWHNWAQFTKKIACVKESSGSVYIPQKDSNFLLLQTWIENQLQNPSFFSPEDRSHCTWLKELGEAMRRCDAPSTFFQKIEEFLSHICEIENITAISSIAERTSILYKFIGLAADLTGSCFSLSPLYQMAQRVLFDQNLGLQQYLTIARVNVILNLFLSLQKNCQPLLALAEKTLINEKGVFCRNKRSKMRDMIDLAFMCSEINPAGQKILFAVERSILRNRRYFNENLSAVGCVKMLAAFGQAGTTQFYSPSQEEGQAAQERLTLFSICQSRLLAHTWRIEEIHEESLEYMTIYLTKIPLAEEIRVIFLKQLVCFIETHQEASFSFNLKTQNMLLQLFQKDFSLPGGKVFQKVRQSLLLKDLSSLPLPLLASFFDAFASRAEALQIEDPELFTHFYHSVIRKKQEFSFVSWETKLLLLVFSAFSKAPQTLRISYRPFLNDIGEELSKRGAFFILSASELTTLAEGYERVEWFPEPIFQEPLRLSVYFCHVFALKGRMRHTAFVDWLSPHLSQQMQKKHALTKLEDLELVLLAKALRFAPRSTEREINPLLEMITQEQNHRRQILFPKGNTP